MPKSNINHTDEDVAVEISDDHISPSLREAMAGEQVVFPIPEAEQGLGQEA